MTEKDELTTNNSSESSDETNINTEDLDVEGALAALSALQGLTYDDDQDDDQESVDDSDVETDDELSSEIEPFERVLDTPEEDVFDVPDDDNASVDTMPQMAHDAEASYDTTFPHPPVSVLHRGQLASVVPAVLLIGIGGYLTFLVTTTESALQLPIVLAIAVVGLGAMLLAQWISTSRWSIGSFFIGVLLLLTGGIVAYLVLPNQLSLIDGYPLILTAIGTAFVITDVFVPSGRRIWLIGLILAISGLAGVVTTTTLINLEVVGALSGLLPVAIVILLVLMIAPFVSRNNS